MSGTYLFNMHHLVRNCAIERRASHKVDGYFLALECRETDIRILGGIDISQVDLVVFLGDESNEMRPCCRRHDSKIGSAFFELLVIKGLSLDFEKLSLNTGLFWSASDNGAFIYLIHLSHLRLQVEQLVRYDKKSHQPLNHNSVSRHVRRWG